MPPGAGGGYQHPSAVHDDTVIAELQAAIAEMNRTLMAEPGADTAVAELEAELTELTYRVSALVEHTDDLEVLVNNTVTESNTMVTYERWGRTVCPNNTGATLVYAGRVCCFH